MIEIPVCLHNTELYYVVLKDGVIDHVRHGYSPKRIETRFLTTATLQEIKIKVFQFQYGDDVMNLLERIAECMGVRTLEHDGSEFIQAKIPAALEDELISLIERYREIK